MNAPTIKPADEPPQRAGGQDGQEPSQLPTDEFERGRQQGMEQERALWELAKDSLEPPLQPVAPRFSEDFLRRLLSAAGMWCEPSGTIPQEAADELNRDTFTMWFHAWGSASLYDAAPPPAGQPAERIAQLERERDEAQMDAAIAGTEQGAYWRGQDDGCRGTMDRWQQALSAPFPAPGVIGDERMEGLYRSTEALRAAGQVPQPLSEATELAARLRESADEVESFPHPSHCDHLHVAFKVMREAAAAIDRLAALATAQSKAAAYTNYRGEHSTRDFGAPAQAMQPLSQFPDAREFANGLNLAVTDEWVKGFDIAATLARVRIGTPDPTSGDSSWLIGKTLGTPDQGSAG